MLHTATRQTRSCNQLARTTHKHTQARMHTHLHTHTYTHIHTYTHTHTHTHPHRYGAYRTKSRCLHSWVCLPRTGSSSLTIPHRCVLSLLANFGPPPRSLVHKSTYVCVCACVCLFVQVCSNLFYFELWGLGGWRVSVDAHAVAYSFGHLPAWVQFLALQGDCCKRCFMHTRRVCCMCVPLLLELLAFGHPRCLLCHVHKTW
jgi:hypothetical protein